MSTVFLVWLFGPTIIVAVVACFRVLCEIERNTRPPKPPEIPLKSFIKQNTKGDLK